MLLYACVKIIQVVRRFLWPPHVEQQEQEQGQIEEIEGEVEEFEGEVEEIEGEVEELEDETPVKRYNLRERRPVDYQD